MSSDSQQDFYVDVFGLGSVEVRPVADQTRHILQLGQVRLFLERDQMEEIHRVLGEHLEASVGVLL